MQYLDPLRFEVIPLGIDKKGNWLLGQDIFIHSLTHQCVTKIHEDSHTWFTPEWLGHSLTTSPIRDITSKGPLFDVIFPAVHGTFCEDGTLQGLLELADVPYVGCGVLASAIGMDKDVAKRLALLAGVPVGPYLAVKKDQWQAEPQHWLTRIEKKLKFPLFVKPANAGSSIGISKAKNQKQLIEAINEALCFDNKILVEQGLSVIELEIAVLESLSASHNPMVSVVGEVKPAHEFYSYAAKYLDEKGADLLIPADIPQKIMQNATERAKQLFITLECEGMARIDLFLEKETYQLYFNEINTIPGFTQISMYPKLMAASGIPYSELLTRLIELAIHKHKNKTQLTRNYKS